MHQLFFITLQPYRLIKMFWVQFIGIVLTLLKIPVRESTIVLILTYLECPLLLLQHLSEVWYHLFLLN